MITPFAMLSPADQVLLTRASEVRLNAYAPYSDFLVGAVVATPSGDLYAGANFENASYGLTLCAEATALGAAVSAGNFQIARVAIVGAPRAGSSPPVTPCGRCRQLIAEAALVSGQDISVLCSDPSLEGALVLPISTLLPYSFALPRDSAGRTA